MHPARCPADIRRGDLRFGGYADSLGIPADLITLGKIIGGGMPVGALTGPNKYMEKLAPLGGVYQAGTLSGNPVSLAAGSATLEILSPVIERGKR